jgi:predicted short-subunit dehydrogenase-like oxidoreductase (DUF2520 family)
MIQAFGDKGIRTIQVLARNKYTAAQVSKEFSVPFILDAGKLVMDADLYILAVRDDEIGKVAAGLYLKDQLLVHTSGFTGLEAISGGSSNTGVIWPLQTLTSGIKADYRQIPFFIEANSKENLEKLRHFAELVSNRVIATDSQMRQKVHLAAVIASNLTNQLYAISASILERQDIPFDVLGPLILETAKKAAYGHPLKSQTGPAVRKDLNVIGKHLDLLRDEPAYRDIYRIISENIIHLHHNKND